ncbi:MAG: hypothetical protein PF485_11500 [Bacteroidales bacterium]|jgi:Tol biopolymer transport system component|nr:hypothetical protein [Bacteroidales bacterium]
MNTRNRKKLLKAVLTGDKLTVNKLLQNRNLYFKDIDIYYMNDLNTTISKEQFEINFRTGFDTLIEFGDKLKQRKALLDVGLSENEVNIHMAKQHTNKQTMNEILTLKNRLQDEK